MATAGVVVSVSMGVMKPVLEKLAALMGDHYRKIKGLRKEVSFLKDELGDMDALLENMDAADELDPQAKKWRKDIIDMSYDVEDYIDDFMQCVGETDDNVGFLRKASHCLKTIKDRYRIANQIKKIKTRVIQTSQRRERYKFNVSISSTTSVVVDPRLSALYNVDSATLVGIDTQKGELVKWAMDEEQQLKVASIVGFGGLGKTTLANEVYRKVGVQFNCKAFVPISQKPDITRLLNTILSQLGLHTNSHVHEKDIIDRIHQHLHDKRYFIVVDDLWDIPSWKAISYAFPQNNQHSRVMITTRNENVARECCGHHGCIHNMKPLSEQDSRKLFFNRVFGSEDACPSQFKEVSCEILKKCGGLPLAIITVSSILACQQPTSLKKQWEYLRDSLATKSAEYSTLEEMMHILDLSYKCLPRHLKACFLYLGTYPEDHEISRVELVRRWVAEGFVSYSPRQDVWDVAESYFNELVNRSMIQPAYEGYDTMMSYCRVHDMMLELIVRRCREDNFISLIDHSQLMAEGQDEVIRRLTIDVRGVEYGTMVMATPKHLSQVRSLNTFGGSNWMPPLLECKFLRVLCLERTYSRIRIKMDLTGINQLSQLRYLKVKGYAGDVVLPAQVRGLRLLETIDLSELRGNPYSLPEFVDVPRLSHLVVSGHVRLPDGIGKVKSLRTLSGFNLWLSSLESIMGLGELTALSELGLRCEARNMGDVSLLMAPCVAALSTSLKELGNLKLLSVGSFSVAYCADALLSSSFLHPFLERLCLESWTFSSVPRWIGHLHSLRELRLGVKRILQEDVGIIGTRLPSLVHLELRIVGVLAERTVIGGSTGFPVLKYFRFDCDVASFLTFEAGAMPNLWELELAIDAREWDKATPVGLQHLPSLKKIKVSRVSIVFRTTGTLKVIKAEDPLMEGMFQEAADALPSCPAFIFGHIAIRRIEKDSFDDMLDDGRSCSSGDASDDGRSCSSDDA